VIHNQSLAKTVAFLVTAAGTPTPSTLIQAINKGYLALPGLTADALRRNPPNSMATAKGHLDQTQQGQRSTKTTLPRHDSDEDTDAQRLRLMSTGW
jgi:hypothetical protein